MKNRIIAGSAMVIGAAIGFPAHGSELDELKAALRQLQQRIEQLESRQKAEAAPAAAPAARPATTAASAAPVTAGSIPGSFRVPGTDTSIKVYGNVRVDATYDFGGRNNDIRNNDWASVVFAQPFDSNGANRAREKQFYATARASRLGVVTNTPTALGDLEVKLEGDFNAPNDYMGELGSNGTQFRLRHAYGRVGNLLLGQTWSNFIDLRSYPETVDFNPTGDVTLIRQAQLRYTLPMGGASLAFSVENPEGLSSLPPFQTMSNAGRNDFDRTPDFMANWTWNGEKAHLSARAVTMEYRNDLHSKRGYALALSGSSMLGAGTLVAGIQGGEGIGRYMFNSVMQGATETGADLRLWKGTGWHLGYTQPWTSTLRSNFIVSRSTFSADTAADTFQRARFLGGADEFIPNKRVDQAFANLFWGITKNTELGLEYAYGKRATFGPEIGTQRRINATAIYSFY